MKQFGWVLPLILIGGCSPSPKNEPVSPEANNVPAVSETNSPEANSPEANSTAPNKEGNSAPTVPPTADAKGPKKPIVPKLPEPVPVEPLQTNGWSKASSQAEVLMKDVDAKIKALTNTRMVFQVLAKVPEGKGTAELVNTIGDSKRYLLRYVRFEGGSYAHFENYIVAQFNGKTKTLVGEKYVDGRVAPTGNILTEWPKNATHFIAAGIGSSRTPFTDLYQAAKKAGWKMSVEKKTYDRGPYTRVIMDSTKGPKTRYEVLINAKGGLPMSIKTEIDGKKKTAISTGILWWKKDGPVTAEDLSPAVKTNPVKIVEQKRPLATPN